jgi:uncharacterized protein YdhG (YjbR/CyaY superfamily)
MNTEIKKYIDGLVGDRRKIYLSYWNRVVKLAPELEKGINYGVPSIRYKKHPVLRVAIYKDHMSLFPNSAKIITKMKSEVGKLETSKLLVLIKFDQKISDAKIKKMIDLRMSEIDNRLK